MLLTVAVASKLLPTGYITFSDRVVSAMQKVHGKTSLSLPPSTLLLSDRRQYRSRSPLFGHLHLDHPTCLVHSWIRRLACAFFSPRARAPRHSMVAQAGVRGRSRMG